MLNKKITKNTPAEILDEKNDESKIININEATINPKYKYAEEYLNTNYKFRYNNSNNEIECLEKDKKEWCEINIDDIYTKMQRQNIPFPAKNLESLLKSDFVPIYNEFANYFNNLPKFNEQDDHIEKLANHIKVPEKQRERFNTMFKKSIVRSVKQALIKGYFNKHCFVIISPKQHIGKTSFIRFICPLELKKYYTQNFGVSKNEKDDQLSLCENIMINIDELAILDRKEINLLKATFSSTGVKARKSYDKKARWYDRKATFWASSNNIEFLEDETGNIRWICFEIDSIDFNYSKVCKIENIYSQAVHLLNTNYSCELTLEEQRSNQAENIKFAKTTIEQELLMQYFEPDKNDLVTNFYTSTQILDKLMKRVSNGIRISPHLLGRALKCLGFEQKTRRTEFTPYPIKGYYILDKGIEISHENTTTEPVTPTQKKVLNSQTKLYK